MKSMVRTRKIVPAGIVTGVRAAGRRGGACTITCGSKKLTVWTVSIATFKDLPEVGKNSIWRAVAPRNVPLISFPSRRTRVSAKIGRAANVSARTTFRGAVCVIYLGLSDRWQLRRDLQVNDSLQLVLRVQEPRRRDA